MRGTAKTVIYKNPGNCLHAGLKRLSHKVCGILAAGSLANSAYGRQHRYGCHNRFPYLEAQAR